MAIPTPGQETDHEFETLKNICDKLRVAAANAQGEKRNWLRETQRLIDKIDTENWLLERLRQQRRRTGDDGFDVDIAQQNRIIINLQGQVDDARQNAHKWEDQAAVIQIEMEANRCDFFQ